MGHKLLRGPYLCKVFYQNTTVKKKGRFEHSVLVTYIQLSQKVSLLVRQTKGFND